MHLINELVQHISHVCYNLRTRRLLLIMKRKDTDGQQFQQYQHNLTTSYLKL